MKRKELSDKIINFIVEQKYEDANIIKEQYENSILELQEDSVGFFINVKYSGDIRTSTLDYEISDIDLKYSNMDVGLTIFIRDGKLETIEAYTYGDAILPTSNDGEPYRVEFTEIDINKEQS